MSCTWKDCQNKGINPQLGKDGREWAVLCDEHAAALEKAIASQEPKKLLGAWSRAGHGHRAREDLKQEMTEGIKGIFQAIKRSRKR